jgi:hypothetical protein
MQKQESEPFLYAGAQGGGEMPGVGTTVTLTSSSMPSMSYNAAMISKTGSLQ